MSRERARTERRDVDLERGEPLADSALRGGPRALRAHARPLPDWTTRPRILITNDDGVESRGLLALRQALDPIGDTIVVAPDTNQSAVGHQKTLMRPLRVRERTLADGSLAYSVDGSPTDAVSLAFLGYFDQGFDLVASGINYGANLGDDITYSGTVSAAMESVINGCPAFAISQEYYEHPDFTLSAMAAAVVARNILEHGLAPGELINVNVPAVDPSEFEGFEVTRLGKRVYQDELIQRVDPRGIPYYWIGGPPPSGLAVEGTDFHAVVNRRIAVTPIHLDLTGRRLLKRLRTWEWQAPDSALVAAEPATTLPPEPRSVAGSGSRAPARRGAPARTPVANGCALSAEAATLLEHDLEVLAEAGREARFAEGQVVLPHPDEPVVEAERPHLVGPRHEPLAPGAQRQHVRGRDVRDAPDEQPRPAGCPLEHRERRAQAAREDVRLDPVRPAQLLLVGGVGEGDHLETQAAARPQRPIAHSKNVPRYSAPTASSISIETIASYVPLTSR